MHWMHTRIFLVRHGEVEKSWQGRIYGDKDVALSDLGKREAAMAGQLLRDTELAAVLSSDLTRAAYGAEQIALGRGLACRADSAFREIDRGSWVGRFPDELDAQEDQAWRAWQRAPTTLHPPGGETLGDVVRRVVPRIEYWADRYAQRNIAIVAHSWVIRVTLCAALGLPLDRAARLQLATGSVSVVDWRLTAVGESQPPRHTLVGIGLDRVPRAAPWFQGSQPSGGG